MEVSGISSVNVGACVSVVWGVVRCETQHNETKGKKNMGAVITREREGIAGAQFYRLPGAVIRCSQFT